MAQLLDNSDKIATGFRILYSFFNMGSPGKIEYNHIMTPCSKVVDPDPFRGHATLQAAAQDFRFFLSRGYPRKPCLDLVGNRYQLTSDQKNLLHRGVFSEKDSRSRKKKKLPSGRISGGDLAIDGYNVLITVEAGLCGRPLIFGDDGFTRDISGLSGNFRQTETTKKALTLILEGLKRYKPKRVLFLFDAPISKSGELAEEVRRRLNEACLPGDAQAVKVPEHILVGYPGIIATSDTAVIDTSEKVLDLAGHILKTRVKPKSMFRWTKRKIISSR